MDDVINVSGHRIGTAEVESALVAHPQCAEAAVVGYEHPVKGQGIWAYVTLLEVRARLPRGEGHSRALPLHPSPTTPPTGPTHPNHRC